MAKLTPEEREAIVELRLTINPKTRKYHTLQEVVDVFGVSREYVRQLSPDTGTINHQFLYLSREADCKNCKKKFVRENHNTRYCSADCKLIGRAKARKYFKDRPDINRRSREYYRESYKHNRVKHIESNKKSIARRMKDPVQREIIRAIRRKASKKYYDKNRALMMANSKAYHKKLKTDPVKWEKVRKTARERYYRLKTN